MIKAILLKPLDGRAVGSTAEFSQADFERLKSKGAVKKASAPENKKASAPENKKAPAPENKKAGGGNV